MEEGSAYPQRVALPCKRQRGSLGLSFMLALGLALQEYSVGLQEERQGQALGRNVKFRVLGRIGLALGQKGKVGVQRQGVGEESRRRNLGFGFQQVRSLRLGFQVVFLALGLIPTTRVSQFFRVEGKEEDRLVLILGNGVQGQLGFVK